jgi:SAM-dependent methyltransferase
VARHIFEYLSDPIKILRECERILIPGGTVHIYLYTTDGRGAFSCPMHKSFWNLDLFLNSLPDSFHIIGGNHEIKDSIVTFEVKIIKKGRTLSED